MSFTGTGPHDEAPPPSGISVETLASTATLSIRSMSILTFLFPAVWYISSGRPSLSRTRSLYLSSCPAVMSSSDSLRLTILWRDSWTARPRGSLRVETRARGCEEEALDAPGATLRRRLGSREAMVCASSAWCDSVLKGRLGGADVFLSSWIHETASLEAVSSWAAWLARRTAWWCLDFACRKTVRMKTEERTRRARVQRMTVRRHDWPPSTAFRREWGIAS
mmetsp:Transcript_883/g.2354  ORF Transcript_883/g.2354 Transcript_883/m.2354 type:complete len:222 (-) Transcript_883:428-1093(-)